MTRHPLRSAVLALSTVAALALTALPAGADPAWSSAEALPGLAALNATGVATVYGLSCASAGNCGLVGTYSDSFRHVQGFVANEVNYVWGSAQAIPGLVDLNAGGTVSFPDISCTAATSCSITGTYLDGSNNPYGFVDDETSGTWGTAVSIPISSTLPTGTQSISDAIKCTSPGNCVATGAYQDVNGGQAFVATETSGTWGGATEIPGTGALNAGGFALGTWLSCPSAGSCVVTGTYTDSADHTQTWIDSESGGSWQTAIAAPGLATLNVGGDAEPGTVACSSVGNCVVGGYYSLSSTESQAFVDDEVSGTWQSAEEFPGSINLNTGSAASVTEVSCPADGQCQAVGVYADNSGGSQDFEASQVGGTWQNMAQLPGTAELNASGKGQIPDVSCVAVGDCRAVGGYGDSTNAVQAFDATETAGVWQNAEESPGTAALNTEGIGTWEWVSCTADGGCAAAGVYKDSSGYYQVMVMSSAAPPVTTAPGAPGERLASKTVGVVTVTITPPKSTGGSPITGYQYSVNGGPWKSTSSTHVTIRHLKPKSKVHVRVRAVNKVGAGAASGTATIKVK